MNCLGLFAKHWTPGRVKTRLAATIGDVSAANLHRACLHALLARMGTIDADDLVLAFSPPAQEPALAALARDALPHRQWRLWPQPDGDLGQRLAAFFNWAFEQGAERVAVIGADSPTLPPSFIDQAFAALANVPVVLGPALDGGYWLVGAAGRTPPIFGDIDWGSSRVWQQTVERLDVAGLPYHVLPEWYDVDEPADLLRLQAELRDADRPEFAVLRRELATILEQRDI